MYRPKTAPHQEKDVREKDILAPRIPANLSVSDLCAGSFNEDDVISVCRSENSMLEDLSADNVSIQQSVFDGCTFRRIAFHGLDVTDVRFVNCNLANVDFGHAVIHRTVFTDCNLTGIDLREATFRNVVFENCIARYSFLRSADMERTAFRSCRL